MKNHRFTILALCVALLLNFQGFSQQIPKEYLQNVWAAKWITVPQTPAKDYGVYLFRKEIELKETPSNFTIYASADNRFQLFVNEKLVGYGPAKGDLWHWKYDIIDIAPYLKQGKNLIAVKVWNEGEFRPENQISSRTGLVIQGSSATTQMINTDNTWKCTQDKSYQPIVVNSATNNAERATVRGYYVAGAGQKVEMKDYIKNWEKVDFDDATWSKAQVVMQAMPENTVGLDAGNSWRLVPSPLPLMELKTQRFEQLRKATGVTVVSNFPKEKSPILIPANTTSTLLLDQGVLTNAYPSLLLSGGKDAKITLTYSESLFLGNQKGNRNEIEGKQIMGRKDVVFADGTEHQTFSTFSYRTFRYVEIKIETKDSSLSLDDVFSTFTGYPFQLKAKLNTDLASLNQIFEIGWRTARLCAFDTYMDCPYYEQLQYIGDTRIQAMVSLYNTGDDRLVKNALNLIDYSRLPEGVTASRYPTFNQQIIPTFSLWYIGMLYDYLMYGSDAAFVSEKLMGVRQILHYFEGFRAKDGSLKNLPNWFFVDWVSKWGRGMPPIGKDGSSALLDFQLLLAYQYASALEQQLGMPAFAQVYEKQANELTKTIQTKYWDESKKLFADTPEKNSFSQHANSLAILAGIVPNDELKAVGKQLLTDNSLTQGSIYFKYYINQALTKAGLGDDYLNWLGIWQKNIDLGMSTWGEDSKVESTRSDCHAWGASPNIEFFRIVLGIESVSPNFKTVKIEPHLGTIQRISGEMPHPAGMISVNYDLDQKLANINLPAIISGQFIWKGKTHLLKGGKNVIRL